MSDPLSVAASITGLIALAGQLYNALDGFISNVRDAPSLAQTIQFEIKSFRNSLNALHGVLQNPGFCRNKRASLIPADYVIVSFTDAVLVFSQLETNVIPLTRFTDFGVVARMQWTRKKVKLNELVGRLQWQKQTLVLQLNILRCASDIEAERDRQVLDTLICGRRGKDRDMERRLELVEQQLQLQETASIHRSSIISTDTADSDNLTIRAGDSNPSDEPPPSAGSYQHAFEELLNSSWVYRRNKNREEDMSMRSSVLRLSAWSVLSDMSLANISVIAVMSLPVQLQELCNGGWYRASSDSAFSRTEDWSDISGSSFSANVGVDDDEYDTELDPSTREAIERWNQIPSDRTKIKRKPIFSDLSYEDDEAGPISNSHDRSEGPDAPAGVNVGDEEYDTDDDFKTTWAKDGPNGTSPEPSHRHDNTVTNLVPSTDNFRTSLLMPGLAARFDMLREQDDPKSMLGRASDDSVLQPRRRSRTDFGGRSDNAEVSSMLGDASVDTTVPPADSNPRQVAPPKLKLELDQRLVFDFGWQTVRQAGEKAQTNQLVEEDRKAPEEVEPPLDKPAKVSPSKSGSATKPLKSILKTTTRDAPPETGEPEEPSQEERRDRQQSGFPVHKQWHQPPLYDLEDLELDDFEEDDVAYPCKGCGEILEEGKAFELAGNRWHIECFRCNTCDTLLDSDANLLLLGDGSLICNNCTYSCSACGNKIEDLAILTGDQAFCSSCFKCRNCKCKIENLRYARTSQGIFCMKCHEALMARRRKRGRAAPPPIRRQGQEEQGQVQNESQDTDYATDDEAAGTMAPPSSPKSGHPNGVLYKKGVDPIEDGISI